MRPSTHAHQRGKPLEEKMPPRSAFASVAGSVMVSLSYGAGGGKVAFSASNRDWTAGAALASTHSTAAAETLSVMDLTIFPVLLLTHATRAGSALAIIGPIMPS